MNIAEYSRMFDAEERQWWYVGMRALSEALLVRGGVAAEGALRILDAGCGTGNNLLAFAKYGTALGIDLSADAIAFCRARGVPVVRGSVLDLPVRAQAVDGVTSLDVLYHAWVKDDRRAVLEMARVVRSGGFVLVRVPALRVLWGAHDDAVLSRHRYTRGELVRLLESAGLRVVVATYANSILFPLVLARRLVDRATGRKGSDVGFLAPPFEWLFRHVLFLEAWIVRRASLPLGASVMALARKT